MVAVTPAEAGNKPGRLNLQVSEGAPFALPFTVKADGVAQDLTGRTPKSEIRDSSGVLVVEFDLVTGTDLPNGVIQFNLTAVQVDALVRCTSYFYDLYIDGPRTWLLTGCVQVFPTGTVP